MGGIAEAAVAHGNPSAAFLTLIFTRSIEKKGASVYPVKIARISGFLHCLIVSFHRWSPEKRAADLNIKIHASYRGHGYAKDAMGVFLKFFFERVKGELLVDDLLKENTGGRQLLETFGFSRDSSVSEVCRLTLDASEYQDMHNRV